MRTIDASPEKPVSRTKGRHGRLGVLAPLAGVPVLMTLALVTATVGGAPSAAAEPAAQSGGSAPQCGARDAVLDRLSSKYGELPVSIGVTATGSLLEVLASADGNTWTIIVTVPGGPTCLVSSGEGWHNAPMQLAEDPAV